MAKYRNFWVSRADTKSVSPSCSLEKMQKSIAQKALQCLCPHMNSIFSQLLLIYLPRQTDASWGLLPILCHQRWAAVKTQQSMCWKAELVQKPWFASPIFTHICTYSCMHTWLKEHLLLGEPSLQTGASCLLPSVHNFSLPPSVKCITEHSRVGQKMLLIWTYPGTELHCRSISAQPVRWGGFGRLPSPLTWYRTVDYMWKNTSCYTSPGALVSLMLLHGCTSGINQGL